jgi:hypothetical protein
VALAAVQGEPRSAGRRKRTRRTSPSGRHTFPLQPALVTADDALVDASNITQEQQDLLVGRALREYTEALKRGQLLAAEVHKVGEHLRAVGQQIMQHAHADAIAKAHSAFSDYFDAAPLLKLIAERDEYQNKVSESVRTLSELGLAPVTPTKQA